MLRTSARRGIAGGTALVVGLAGLAIGQGAASASPPLPVSQAGPVAIWGPGDVGDGLPLPAPTPGQASQAFTKVVANGAGSAIGLTAAGKVELIGDNIFATLYPSDAIPAALAGKTVVDIAGGGNYGNGMAVTGTGEVYTWNLGIEGWATALPGGPLSSDPEVGDYERPVEELQGSVAAAISVNETLAAVVKQDGSVRVWGTLADGEDHGQTTPPEGLADVTSVFFSGSSSNVFALKSDGTLVAWGREDAGEDLTDLPAVTTDPARDVDVTDVASAGFSAVALLSDGTLTAWGSGTAPGQTYAVPPALDGKEVVAVAANSGTYFAVDSDGEVYTWGGGTVNPAFTQLPAGVDPANITGLSANDYYATAIQAAFSYVARPTISGTAKVGETLTATPATFTAVPDEEPVGQWYRGSGESAEPISGATGTAYQPTAADVGTVLTYTSTATRGEATATATSDPTAAVAAAGTPGGGDNGGDAQQQKIAQAQQAYNAATATATTAKSALATASAPKPVKAYIKALTKVTKAQAKVTAAQKKVSAATSSPAKKKAKKALTKAKKALAKAKKAVKKPKKKAGAAGKKYDAALVAYTKAVTAQTAAAQALAAAQAGR